MPTATRTFRVFVSSTFEDLKAERDALQREVFPKLRKLCEQNGARFQAIDLRWGVRDEAALDQQTMEICLREIERCQQTGIKPNFIVLLGDRYGWRPLPARIEAQEFNKIRDQAANAGRQLIDEWYERDNNAEPPEFLLKPRTGEFVDKERWEEEEQKLHGILLQAARAVGLLPESLIRYEASATHQEILKGLGETQEDRRHVFAFFRESAPGEEEDADLTALKEDLRKKLPAGNIHPFPAADFAQLCADVEEQLSAVIKAEMGRVTSRPALDLEIEAHEKFACDRAQHFTGRKSVLDAIDKYLRGGDRRPLVVHGPSGCGKSAIVVRASAQARAEKPGVVLIQRFIGVTPASSTGITLLQSLCEQLSREYRVSEETPIGFQPLVVAFHDRLARATANRPLVLFLDALDQLHSDDEARSFTWLRQNLPNHVSLVVSTTEVPAGLKSAPQFTVEDFPVDEAEEVLAAWLVDARRKLQPEQRERVLSNFAESGLPLYLKLAFEEARRWRSFETEARCVLGNDVGGVIDVLFNRLSEETNQGPILVSRSLGFLAAARYGLTEDEMLDVLAADDDVWGDFESRAHHKPPERRLPVVVWSRLFLDIEPYLNERAVPGGNVMAFYHRQVAERVAPRFLQGHGRASRHAELATYFGKQSYWRNQSAMQANERKITELVQQQIGADALTDLETTLTDIDFIAAKCAANLVFDLQLDYHDAIAALPEAQEGLRLELVRQLRLTRWTEDIIAYSCEWSERRDRLAQGELVSEQEPRLPVSPASCRMWTEEETQTEYQRINEDPTRLDRLTAFAMFVESESCPLDRFGERECFTRRHAANYAPNGPVSDAARDRIHQCDVPLLLRQWSPGSAWNPKPAMLRTLEGHTWEVNSVSITPDGKRAVSGSDDKTLRVWDLESGAMLRTLEGHTNSVNSVSVTPDGKRAVSGSSDNTLRVWDVESGAMLRTLEGHTREVNSVSVTPDGKRAVSVSRDKMRVWDLESGACLHILSGAKNVSVTPDGKRAVSGSWDKMRVWDLESGACLRTLEGHNHAVVSLTPDGKRAVSGSSDNTLRVWDVESGACLRTLVGHTHFVTSASVAPDRKRAVSGSSDKTLRVWDLESGTCLRTVKGYTSYVLSVSLTQDGKRAVWAGPFDNTLQVSDLGSGARLRTLEGHTNSVNSVSVTPDGKRAVSGSNDKTLRMWDVESGTCLRTLEGHTDRVTGLSVTPDGKRAVSGSDDKTLRVWDLESGACLRTLVGHTNWVNRVSVTPDGKRAVSGSWDYKGNTLRVWDLESGACLRTLEGHTDEVTIVSVTPDGKRAVSAGGDNTLRVWDLESGVCLAIAWTPAPIWHLTLSSVRGRVIAGTNTGEVLQYDLCGIPLTASPQVM